MDFLDYVKMCQEETTTEKNDNREFNYAGNNSLKKEEDGSDEMTLKEWRGPACRGQLYKVERGDTLYSISRKYNLRVRDLMQANPFVNVYNLQVGEELCIPVLMGGRPSPNSKPYVVKREDTVLSILNENNISFKELARMNRSAAVLKFPAGTVLLLPK